MAKANVDPYGFMMFKREADGSVTRLGKHPVSPPSDDLSNPFHLTKDLPINQSKNTSARVFVPREAFDSSPSKKYPVIIYFHAGGCVFFGATTSLFDNFYAAITPGVPAVIVSVDFRNGPEHRLPAAYNDCFEALHWIKSSDDDWVTKYADMSKCFLMGSSAGGIISYQIGLRAAAIADDLKPLEIKGLILHHPFVGGVKRTDSELKLANDHAAPLCITDILWELSLPVGADRDHEYCNLVNGIKPKMFDKIKSLGWKILMLMCDGDPMLDRQIEFFKKLEEDGVEVSMKLEHGGSHIHELFNANGSKSLSKVVKEFVDSLINS